MRKIERKNGITVIICCYNSSERITETLYALGKQRFSNDIFWEVVIVDNGSTDNTSLLAVSVWKTMNMNVPLQVVYEPLPGLTQARKTGIATASCQMILFCDDDNWFNRDYVEGMYNILTRNGEIAACGGKGIPVFETSEPEWFNDYHEAFATGSQELTRENEQLLNLYGAGMAMNRKMLDELEEMDFRPFMNGRTGKSLSSAEDTELTYALVLMGYRLHYEEKLQFRHYMSKERMNKKYLLKLFTAFGTDGPIRNIYYSYISDRFPHRYIRNWFVHFTLAMVRFVKYLIIPPKRNGRMIYYKWNLSYIGQLLKMRKNYKNINSRIRDIKNNHPQATTGRVYKYIAVPSKSSFQ